MMNTELICGIPVQYVISNAVNHGSDRIEIYGTDQTLVYDVASERLLAAKAEEPMGDATLAPNDIAGGNTWHVEEDFINAIREGTPYQPSFLDGLKYMQVVHAAHESADQRKVMTL